MLIDLGVKSLGPLHASKHHNFHFDSQGNDSRETEAAKQIKKHSSLQCVVENQRNNIKNIDSYSLKAISSITAVVITSN